MKILCTHPGMFGDLLWSLPTVRAIAEHYQTRVDFLISPPFATEGLCRLLVRQLYLGRVATITDWELQAGSPLTPRVPPTLPPGYDLVVHLGLDGWPQKALGYESYRLAQPQVPGLQPPDLSRPWIGAPYPLPPIDIAVGFTDEYFEMKYGLYWLLRDAFAKVDDPNRTGNEMVNVSNSPRWNEKLTAPCDWESAAAWIAAARVFIGCNSALHVLACAVGTPVVMLEPQTARHHDCFYPYGKLGPQVTLVTGNDGLPTFDSRHLIDTARAMLAAQVAPQEVT